MVKDIQTSQQPLDVQQTTVTHEGGREQPDFWETLMCIVHDLRNSLGAMKGYATLMFNDLNTGDKKYACTKKILDCIDSIEKLFQDIQAVARRGNVRIETVLLQDILSQNTGNQLLKKRRQAVEISEIFPDKPIYIQFSTPMFSRMVDIIVDEMSSLYDKIEIEIKEKPAKNVRINFKGIAELDENMDVLLELADYKMKKTMNDVAYLILKKIVEIHQGEIGFEVSDDSCEKYWIELPVIQKEDL